MRHIRSTKYSLQKTYPKLARLQFRQYQIQTTTRCKLVDTIY